VSSLRWVMDPGAREVMRDARARCMDEWTLSKQRAAARNGQQRGESRSSARAGPPEPVQRAHAAV
jgi:hypothetical protein